MTLEEKIKKVIDGLEAEIRMQVDMLADVAVNFDEKEIKGYVVSLSILSCESNLLKELLK